MTCKKRKVPLAEWLGGTYVCLPNAHGEQIAALAGEARLG